MEDKNFTSMWEGKISKVRYNNLYIPLYNFKLYLFKQDSSQK